jgi:capsular exopolysaccharide synthesis family protein
MRALGGIFMDDKKMENRQEMEIDFQRIFGAVWKRAGLIILVSVLTAVLSFLYTYFLVTPKYESSAMFYVNNNALSIGNVDISTGDLSAAKELVDSYIVILTSRTTLDQVMDYSGVRHSYDDLRDMISASAVNSTEIFEIVVTSTDPKEAEQIASAICYILPKRIGGIIEGTSAKIVDTAVLPTRPSSPSFVNNVILGFLLGFALSVTVIVLREIFDVTIREEEDISQHCPHPILTAVPDMLATSKGGYGYYYGYGNHRSKATNSNKQPVMMGKDLSFTVSEAYKLLRTKLQFSFAGDQGCRVIGVSSAMAGEGKSLSAVNLAYSLSQLDKKVILIDCDMRRPSLATKLSINKYPGLSNYLSGLNTFEELIQPCGLKGEENAFGVVTAGRNPPNPVELLSSDTMMHLLEQLRQEYDYVLLDLPPVGEVSDALAIAKQTDGMLLVVRQNYCNYPAVAATVRQFEFVEARILGVIFNATREHTGKYGKKYYKKYGKYGRYKYAYGYQRAEEEREGSDQKK